MSHGITAFHRAVPDIWLLVAYWALLSVLPQSIPFLLVLFTELRSDEAKFITGSATFGATSKDDALAIVVG